MRQLNPGKARPLAENQPFDRHRALHVEDDTILIDKGIHVFAQRPGFVEADPQPDLLLEFPNEALDV